MENHAVFWIQHPNVIRSIPSGNLDQSRPRPFSMFAMHRPKAPLVYNAVKYLDSGQLVFLRSAVTASLAVCTLLGSAEAVPLVDKLRSLTPAARDTLKRAAPAAPHFVVYSDKYVSTKPTMAEINGFNVLALLFLLTSGAADEALAWQELTASERTTNLGEYNEAGISLIVSLFGSTDTPTTSGDDPITTANTGCLGFRVQFRISYQNFTAFGSGTGSAEQWLRNFTTQLCTQLPQGQYILTHAPIASWFSPGKWGGGGYLKVNEVVGSMIDWCYLTEGTTEYTTCEGLLYNSSSTSPKSSIFQISANDVILDKLVIGKPATTADANDGFMNTTLLASCVAEAYVARWITSRMPPNKPRN
ncbi:hypothetical protein OG21DRAFT_1599586 [Imleria badia]|nr:hypothetical protein OG21DRAFT_1599586 [Imleria badia]